MLPGKVTTARREDKAAVRECTVLALKPFEEWRHRTTNVGRSRTVQAFAQAAPRMHDIIIVERARREIRPALMGVGGKGPLHGTWHDSSAKEMGLRAARCLAREWD